jgi:hypothetical protein
MAKPGLSRAFKKGLQTSQFLEHAAASLDRAEGYNFMAGILDDTLI